MADFTVNEIQEGPVIDEKRVLFECRVDRVATFGKP